MALVSVVKLGIGMPYDPKILKTDDGSKITMKEFRQSIQHLVFDRDLVYSEWSDDSYWDSEGFHGILRD